MLTVSLQCYETNHCLLLSYTSTDDISRIHTLQPHVQHIVSYMDVAGVFSQSNVTESTDYNAIIDYCSK